VTFFAVVAGLCPLIPVPFVDDWALRRVRRAMARDLGGRSRRVFTAREARVLTGTDARAVGCLGAAGWLLNTVVFGLLAGLLRKIFYLLALRDGVRRATEVFHEGYLLLVVLRAGHGIPEAGWTEHQLRAVHEATAATYAALDPRPVRRALGAAFRASFALLSRSARVLGGLHRKGRTGPTGGEAGTERETEAALREEERLLGGVVDRLAHRLWQESAYLARMEETLWRHLDRRDA
jgi:hypothetical protein